MLKAPAPTTTALNTIKKTACVYMCVRTHSSKADVTSLNVATFSCTAIPAEDSQQLYNHVPVLACCRIPCSQDLKKKRKDNSWGNKNYMVNILAVNCINAKLFSLENSQTRVTGSIPTTQELAWNMFTLQRLIYIYEKISEFLMTCLCGIFSLTTQLILTLSL